MYKRQAFAASNTNIIIKGNNTWLVSGGKKTRVFYSSDKGITWKVYETPIVQGEAMTGIFTADFYNDKIGFVAGGNYEKPNQNFQNKALTIDGGKTWKLVGENAGFGYASCVQFVPNSNGKELVAVGANGLFYSHDSGNSWTQFSKDATFYTCLLYTSLRYKHLEIDHDLKLIALQLNGFFLQQIQLHANNQLDYHCLNPN